MKFINSQIYQTSARAGTDFPLALLWELVACFVGCRANAEIVIGMWSTSIKQLDGRTRKTIVHWNGAVLSMRQTYELCVSSVPFRQAFMDELAAIPFPAYFWETPPVTLTTAERAFEFVVTDAPTLATVGPEIDAFREHFEKDSLRNGVVQFENVSRDAVLVVPCPLAEHSSYTHFAAFIRNAPRAQVHALLRAMGEAVLARWSHRPLWVSTAGMGVYWLHLRLDSRPKYYRHMPYTSSS